MFESNHTVDEKITINKPNPNMFIFLSKVYVCRIKSNVAAASKVGIKQADMGTMWEAMDKKIMSAV